MMMVGKNITPAKKNDLVFVNSIDVSRYVCMAGARRDINIKISTSGDLMICDLSA